MAIETSADGTEERFARRVRIEREARNLSQADLAKLLSRNGLRAHSTTIAKIETRDSAHPRTIRLDEAAALARIFDTTLDDLIGNPRPYDPNAGLDLVSKTAHHTQQSITLAIDQLNESLNALSAAAAHGDHSVDSPPAVDLPFQRRALIEAARPKLRDAVHALKAVLHDIGGYPLYPEDTVRERFRALALHIRDTVTPLTSPPEGTDNHLFSNDECTCGWMGSKRHHLGGHREWVAEQRAIADSIEPSLPQSSSDAQLSS